MARSFRNGPPVLVKYLLLEVPGWVLAAIVLSVLVRVWELSPRTALLLFAIWVAKDFALYPLLRIAYTEGGRDGTEGLLGALGTARERLDPSGYVRVGAELWRARVSREDAPVESGATVRVRSVRDLTLHVEPVRSTLRTSSPDPVGVSRARAPSAPGHPARR